MLGKKEINAEINALLKRNIYVGAELLQQLLNSQVFTKGDWEAWQKAGKDALENRLGHLGMVLSIGMDPPPDKRPFQNKTKRKQRADKVRKQLRALAASLLSIELDEASTWEYACWKCRGKVNKKIAEKYPQEKWHPTVPPMVYLREGWESGVEASMESLPILLDVFKETLNTWESGNCWPINVRKKADKYADRTYFVKTVRSMFKERYCRPLNSVVASLANVFFPNHRPPMTEKMVSKKGA